MAKTEEEGEKVKPLNQVHDFTEHQARELYLCKTDPIYFIENYVKIKVVKHGMMPFKMYEYQKRLIKIYMNNERVISMLSRQCGKTITAAAFLLWWAIFKDNQNLLVASKDHPASKEIMERIWFAYEELPWWIKPGTRKNDVNTKHFDNGSKIEAVATTETTGRGKSISLLYLDEFAFVSPRIASEFWTAIFPTLSSGGNCIITSTPDTDEDQFAKIWFGASPHEDSDVWEDKMAKRYAPQKIEKEERYETIFETDYIEGRFKEKAVEMSDEDNDDDEGFVSFHAHWTSVPERIKADGTITKYRGEEFKRKQMKQGFTYEQWMREYECCFITGEDTLISGTKLASLRMTVREPRFVDKWGCRWYEHILPSTPYMVVMDPSGDGIGDDAAIQVWEVPYLKQVAEWNSEMADQQEQVRMLRRVLMRIDGIQNNIPEHDGMDRIYYSVERNAIGIGIIKAIDHVGFDRFPGWFIDASDVSLNSMGEKSGGPVQISNYRGLLTTMATKKRYAQEFKQLIERNLFLVRSRFLSSQLKNFVKTGAGWKAKDGSKDDLVMSCILMCHLIDEVRGQEIELDDYIRPLIEEEFDPADEDSPEHHHMAPIV